MIEAAISLEDSISFFMRSSIPVPEFFIPEPLQLILL
jgi:hypothetical protein